MISGWVTVTGPPAAIWRWNSGTTEPLEPSTLPKRTMLKRVPAWALATPWHTSSARRLLAPITLVGRTALSVDTNTKLSTPASTAAQAVSRVPITLLRSPSTTLCSTIGTCL